MKGMKGMILKKLKSIPQVSYLKQDRILRLNASDGILDSSSPPPRDSIRILRELPSLTNDQNNIIISDPPNLQPEIIDVAELMRDLDDNEADAFDDKENTKIKPASTTPMSNKKKSDLEDEEKENTKIKPSSTPTKKKSPRVPKRSDLFDVSSFRRPDLDSSTLFDPDLLAAFEQAVEDHIRSYNEARTKSRALDEENPHQDDEPPSKIPRIEDGRISPLREFEEKYPPGGRESIILYTTSLRGIRKTFEDCNKVRFLLQSSKVSFYERDVSMHKDFKEELWAVLGSRAVPPRLFIKGRYIGGADEVLRWHEQGRFFKLVEGMPFDSPSGSPCEGCGGFSFVMCRECNGGRKLYDADCGEHIQCRRCNENGLVLCSSCS